MAYRKFPKNFIHVVIGDVVDFVHDIPDDLSSLCPDVIDEYAVGVIVGTLLAMETEKLAAEEIQKTDQ